MSRVRRLSNKAGEIWHWFICPGCGENHMIPTNGPRAWAFNGDLERPTLKPSILAKWQAMPTEEEAKIILAGGKVDLMPYVCHSFVTDGRIQFLGDCTHEMAGQTVDLPEMPEDEP